MYEFRSNTIQSFSLFLYIDRLNDDHKEYYVYIDIYEDIEQINE